MTNVSDHEWIERFIPQPELSEGGSCFKWENIEVKVSEKGEGVWATNLINPGLNLPYGGVNMDQRSFISLQKNPSKQGSGDYLISGLKDENENERSGRNADPKLYPECAPKNAWIGSTINEPSFGEIANCRLVVFHESDEVPDYPFIQHWPDTKVFVEIFRVINAGEELMGHYGWSDRLRKMKGYTVRQTVVKDSYERYYVNLKASAVTMNKTILEKKRKTKTKNKAWKEKMNAKK